MYPIEIKKNVLSFVRLVPSKWGEMDGDFIQELFCTLCDSVLDNSASPQCYCLSSAVF